MSFWTNFLGAAAGSTAVALLATLVFKLWVGHSFDIKLAKFQSSIDKLSFVSTALYKNREQMIFEFDRCLRGLMGHWHCLVSEYPNSKKEFGFRWKELLQYHGELQSAHFRSRLVFPEDLLELTEEIFKLAMDTHQTGRKVAHYHSVRLDYKFDEEMEALPANMPYDIFENARDKVAKQAAHINNSLIPKWEDAARSALMNIDEKPST